jgi:hypothetical protein
VFSMGRSGRRSLYSAFVTQAAITVLFVLFDARVISHTIVAAEVAAAVLTLGVGLIIRARQTQATWLLAMGFEILYVIAGIALFVAGHVYMVGTIIAIGNIMRLGQTRGLFGGAQGVGQPGAPYGPVGPYGQPGGYGHGQPGGYGQPNGQPYGQPGEYGQPDGPVVQGTVDQES